MIDERPVARHRSDASSRMLPLRLRSRVELFKGSGDWQEVTVARAIPVEQTALLLCDVWDDHWCRGAVRRLEAMLPRMDATVSAARAAGVQVIHAPSETMPFYAGTPQRQRMLDVPRVPLPEPKPLESPPPPIDASDGGCDSGEPPWHKAWSRQHPGITIAEPDLISDNGHEIYSFMAHQGITTLILLGVHTNMCILNRSFAIKHMTKLGVHCLLVRDLTDAMYNPKMPPYVSHEEGTALVIEHIEQYWCPSIVSDDLLALAAPASGT